MPKPQIKTENDNMPKTELIDQAISLAKVLDVNKAEEIQILNLENVNSYLSTFILCNALTDSHSKKLANDAIEFCKSIGYQIIFPEKFDYSTGWLILDFGPLVVHIFNRENRDYYQLENLWKNAANVEWQK